MNDAGLQCQLKCPQAGVPWSPPPALTFTGGLTSSGAKIPDPSKGTLTMAKAPTFSLVQAAKPGGGLTIGAPSALPSTTTPALTSDGQQVIVPANVTPDTLPPQPMPDSIAPWHGHQTALIAVGVVSLAAVVAAVIIATRKK